MQFKDHRHKKLLENMIEFTLILPIMPALEKSIVVCVIYQWEGRIWMKQFQEQNCEAMSWVAIGKVFFIRAAIAWIDVWRKENGLIHPNTIVLRLESNKFCYTPIT